MATTVVVDLKDQDLEARSCGACRGSHSDNKIRAKVEDDVTTVEMPADHVSST